MIVVDASVVVAALLRTDDWDRLEGRFLEPNATFHAPHLLDVEVHQVLRRYSLASEVNETRCAQARAAFEDLLVVRYPHRDLLARAWDLRGNLTIYDGVYVALAEALGAPLWTLDAKLAKSARKLTGVTVLD